MVSDRDSTRRLVLGEAKAPHGRSGSVVAHASALAAHAGSVTQRCDLGRRWQALLPPMGRRTRFGAQQESERQRRTRHASVTMLSTHSARSSDALERALPIHPVPVSACVRVLIVTFSPLRAAC